MTKPPVPNGPVTLDRMKEIIQASPFNRFLGFEILEFDNGRVEISLPIREELTQFHGYAHGAVVGAVADVACAWAAVSIRGNVVTGEYKINFIAPAVGERLIGRGQVLKSSGRQVVCRSDVFAVDQEGEKLVATALATIVPLNPRNQAEEP